MKTTIAMKMTCFFLLAGLTPLAVVSYLNYNNSVEMMRDEISENLDAIAETKASYINSYLESRKSDVESLSHNPVIKDILPRLMSSYSRKGIHSAEHDALDKTIRPYMAYHMEAHEYYDLFLISPSGDILFTVMHEDDFGTNLKTGPYRESELAKSFSGAISHLEATMSDFRFYGPSNEPAAFLVAPIYDNGILIGLLGAQMDTEVIYRLVQEYSGLGKTGETVIGSQIGDQAVFMNPLRHDPDAAFKREVSIGSIDVGPIQLAVQGKKGTGVFTDYRGEEVLAAWRYLPHLRLGMVVKQDTAEAFAPIGELRDQTLGIGAILIFGLICAALILSKTISLPIRQLTNAAEMMAAGDLSIQTKIRTNDEIGDLGRCFNGMVTSTKGLFESLEQHTKDLELTKTELSGALAQAEAAALETEILQRTINQHSLVSVTDARGRITQINDKFCKISRYTREELIGKDHRILNSGTHPKSFWIEMWKTVSLGESWRGAVCNKAKDGSLYWVDSIISPFTGSDGKIEKFVSIRTDITESKHAAKKLSKALATAEVANQSKSAFLANMSHEIRTPLTAILGFTDLLRDEGEVKLGKTERIQAIDTIRNAGKHLLTIINDILDLSKIEADKMTTEQIDTSLIEVLGEVQSLMRPYAIDKGLSLNTTLATPVPEHILSDPTRLRQILMNLMGNAIKFTKAGSISIIASTMEHDGQSRLIVDIEDTGNGMSKEQAGRLFQAFEQADDTVTRNFGGTGLGLVISRRFANLMGGDVKLLRSELGMGSCFRLVLPIVVVPGSAIITKLDVVREVSSSHSIAVKISGRILLAEDGIDNQRLIAFHLRKSGAELAIADNGKIALEMLDDAEANGVPFGLLLTDMQMPEMDGYTLARTLRDRGSTMPIVALTAHAMAEDRAKCIDAGCDDYATKPIDKLVLLATCAEWIGKVSKGVQHKAA